METLRTVSLDLILRKDTPLPVLTALVLMTSVTNTEDDPILQQALQESGLDLNHLYFKQPFWCCWFNGEDNLEPHHIYSFEPDVAVLRTVKLGGTEEAWILKVRCYTRFGVEGVDQLLALFDPYMVPNLGLIGFVLAPQSADNWVYFKHEYRMDHGELLKSIINKNAG